MKRRKQELIEEWSDEDLARGFGWLRLLLGLALFLFPGLTTKTWTGENPDDAPTNLAVRGMGVRDMAIGAGLLTAMERGAPVRGWLEAGAMVDAGDALGTLFSWRGLGKPRGVLWFVTEAGSAAFALSLAERMD
ncbi:MAG: hypothetical protein KY391_00190 [Actinobacteria bacterium]|nr:hypothetical protein [Actinomycetota bacterium]